MIVGNLNDIKRKGWTIGKGIVEQELIDELKLNNDKFYEVCRSIQIKNGIEANTDGTVHHLLAFNGVFFRIF